MLKGKGKVEECNEVEPLSELHGIPCFRSLFLDVRGPIDNRSVLFNK